MLGPLVIVDNLVNQICVCKDLLLALLKSFLQSPQKKKKEKKEILLAELSVCRTMAPLFASAAAWHQWLRGS